MRVSGRHGCAHAARSRARRQFPKPACRTPPPRGSARAPRATRERMSIAARAHRRGRQFKSLSGSCLSATIASRSGQGFILSGVRVAHRGRPTKSAAIPCAVRRVLPRVVTTVRATPHGARAARMLRPSHRAHRTIPPTIAPPRAEPTMSYALVALPVPVRQLFTYRVPEPLDVAAVPGAPVEVPFRGRVARGVLVARIASTPLENVRDLGKITGAPLLTPHLLELAKWVADYYLAPPGEVIAAALPGGNEGLARSLGRRHASEDAVLRMPIPERITLTPAQ